MAVCLPYFVSFWCWSFDDSFRGTNGGEVGHFSLHVNSAWLIGIYFGKENSWKRKGRIQRKTGCKSSSEKPEAFVITWITRFIQELQECALYPTTGMSYIIWGIPSNVHWETSSGCLQWKKANGLTVHFNSLHNFYISNVVLKFPHCLSSFLISVLQVSFTDG